MVRKQAPVGDKGWRQVGREFGGMVLSPGFLLFVVVSLTMRYWVRPIIYLFLRSFEIAPSGFWAWLALSLLALMFVYGLGSFFYRVARGLPLVRRAREELQAGEAGAQERLDQARAAYRKSVKLRYLILCIMAFPLMTPPAASLALWSALQIPAVTRVHRKWVIESPQSQLRHLVSRLERKGIFTPLDLP